MPNSIDTAEKNAFKGSCYGHVAVLGQFHGQVIQKQRRISEQDYNRKRKSVSKLAIAGLIEKPFPFTGFKLSFKPDRFLFS